VNLQKLLIEDEEKDWITVSSDTELQEAFKFGAKQNHLNIKAICTNKQNKPATESNLPFIVIQKSFINTQAPNIPPCDRPINIFNDLRKQRQKKNPVHFSGLPRHNAYCDSCKQNISGIRYKCSVCPDFDLCSDCEAKNLEQNFHPQLHYFLKINKPVRNSYLRRLVQPDPLPVLNNSNQELEDRLAAAESRILSLESKFPTCRWRRSFGNTEQSQNQNQGIHCPRRRGFITVKTTPTQDMDQIPPESLIKVENEDTQNNLKNQPQEFRRIEITSVGTETENEEPEYFVIEANVHAPKIQKPEEEEPVKVDQVNEVPAVVQENSIVNDVVEESKEEEKEEIPSPLVTQLISMGFDKASIKKAVEKFTNLETAVNYLLGDD